jgi:hypothetical protein
MKELSENLFIPLLFILIISVFYLNINNENWTNYLNYQYPYSVADYVSPDVIVETPNISCPKCECPTVIPVIDPNISPQRDYRVINDPLYPPEQRSDTGSSYYPNPTSLNFRIPTRGYPPPYQLKGYLVDENNNGNILQLFGRPKYPGSSEFQYYVSKRDINNNEIKIDIPQKRELYNDDRVKINKIFNGDYKYVELKMEDLIQPPIYY